MPDEDEKVREGGHGPENKKSKLNFMKGIVKYFDSSWSYARFKVPNEDPNYRQTCAFS